MPFPRDPRAPRPRSLGELLHPPALDPVRQLELELRAEADAYADLLGEEQDDLIRGQLLA